MSKHGNLLRGLMATKNSPLFQGKFGRMFRCLPAATFGVTDAENVASLTKLADAMSADFDPIKDGFDEEESGIPSLYTYLGQFIDHDLTLDTASSLQKQNDPDALVDFRTPAFDLDCVYGRGPDDQPYMYDGDSKTLLVGDDIQGAGAPNSKDLPRNTANPRRALIGDPRNDENVIVSQLQGLFLRFHNRAVAENPGLSFSCVQELVRFHYQYVVLNDFLPRIVHPNVLSDLKQGGKYDRGLIQFYRYRNEPFMPVEFAGAAYRLGHSMVRPGYRLNDDIRLPIFPVPSQGMRDGLTGFRAMNPAWAIDWARFVDTEIRPFGGEEAPESEKKNRLQLAYRIDTSAVNPLKMLPPEIAKDPSSLPQRNLLRGWRLGLPSGQKVACYMGIKPLPDSDILLGKFVDKNEELKPITSVCSVFKNNCPLWTYILAEAKYHKQHVKIPVKEDVCVWTPMLGPVGGRIVAEVFLGLMFGDRTSYLNQCPNWHPSQGPNYALKDFVNYALGK